MVRQRIRAAIGILDWLHARNLTLAACRQSDLDLWLTNHDDAGRRFGTDHFVRWAIAHNIKRNLQFAATRWTGPTHPPITTGRWDQAKRLLHDDTIDTDNRVPATAPALRPTPRGDQPTHRRRHQPQRRHRQTHIRTDPIANCAGLRVLRPSHPYVAPDVGPDGAASPAAGGSNRMKRQVSYQWRLRTVMAEHNMGAVP